MGWWERTGSPPSLNETTHDLFADLEPPACPVPASKKQTCPLFLTACIRFLPATFIKVKDIWNVDETDLSLGGSSVVRVQMGENITLNCSMRNRDEVAWYLLRSDQLVLLISGEKDKTGRRLLTTYNQNRARMKMTADSWVTRVSLTITGVTESDSGLYFCGVKSDSPEMHFDKPIRLDIEELPKKVDITDEVTERVLMFACVGLAVFVVFLTTLVAGGLCYHRGQQKGWKAAKQEALMDQKSAKMGLI